MNNQLTQVDRLYLGIKRFASTPILLSLIVVLSATYLIQYNFFSSEQDSYWFIAELLKPLFPLIFAINAIYKYKHTKVKGWLLFIYACSFWFIAQSVDFAVQVSPTIRDLLYEHKQIFFYPVFPLAMAGVVGIGLHSFSAISKARVLFDGFILACSISFILCSILLNYGDIPIMEQSEAGIIFLDIMVASIALAITLYRGLDRVILPVAQSLFFNSIADVYRVLYPSKNEFISHPVVGVLTIIAIVGYCFTFKRDEGAPGQVLTAKGEDILRYSIFGSALITLIYASYVFLNQSVSNSVLIVIFSCLVASLLIQQLITYYENRKLLRQHEIDLKNMMTSEEKFRIAFENGPTTLVLLDEEGHILRANKAFCNFTGFSADEIIASALSYIIHPDDRTLFDVNLATVLGQFDGESINVECRFLQRDGSIRWGSASISHIPLTSEKDDDTAEFVVQIEDITDQKVHETELKSLAIKDPLTGLWNRTHLFNLINEFLSKTKEERNQESFALMFIDLDRFKMINDTMGHSAGDVVLHLTSERICSIVGTRGEVARLGGDEFVVLLNPPITETVSKLIAEEIKDSLSQPILLSQGETVITCSIGVVICSGVDLTAEDILRDADAAMYRAKDQGKNTIEISFSKDGKRKSTELKFTNDLRRALNTDQIKVFYQPIVSLATNEIVGFEALSRWVHPKKGIIKPDDFIPLAEDTGLILDIGYFMMEEAFSQLKTWQNAFTTTSGNALTMNVNLSVTQLRDPKLLREIEGVKSSVETASNSMIFEITESAILGDTKRAIALLNDIRDLGFRLRVDDFGTGYSSLAYLKKLPIDGFKIDKSFVSGLNIDIDDTAIIKALLGLAKAMNLSVTAEGIEQDSQRESLKQLGCNYGQGYLFSPPVTADEIVFPTSVHKSPIQDHLDTA